MNNSFFSPKVLDSWSVHIPGWKTRTQKGRNRFSVGYNGHHYVRYIKHSYTCSPIRTESCSLMYRIEIHTIIPVLLPFLQASSHALILICFVVIKCSEWPFHLGILNEPIILFCLTLIFFVINFKCLNIDSPHHNASGKISYSI